MNIHYKKIISIVLISVLLGFAYNYISPKGVSLFGYDNKKLLSEELLGANNSEPKQIHIDEALKLYEAEVVFIDAREHEDYKTGHIKNAIIIPYYDFDNYKKNLQNISKDEPVVTYCGGTDCDLSIMLGNKLSTLGYKKVFIFFGGWNEWTSANHPVDKSGKK